MRSRDLTTREDVTAKLHVPDKGTPVRLRHGTALTVLAALLAKLRAASRSTRSPAQPDSPQHRAPPRVHPPMPRPGLFRHNLPPAAR